ncbi:MAG TPA: M20/M25/M40 family metallo-hydrolase [Candidatus Limnocylindria bacterium]
MTIVSRELVEIDERRLLRRLDELAQRGAVPGGGVTRIPQTPAWVSAIELVSGWMKEATLLVRRDAAGNVWGRVEGSRGGRAIVTGSHIDTVRSGGALDGALGVVAGIEAVASLVARYGRPKRICECVAIAEHEATRYAARAIADRLDPGEVAGDARAASVARRDIDVFVELHVEQGDVLDGAGERLGVVSAVAGSTELEIAVRGEPAAAESTAMERRRDALLGASEMIVAVAAAAREVSGSIASVTGVSIEPAQAGVVAALARFTVELRHADDARRVELAAEIDRRCKVIGRANELEVVVRAVRERHAVRLSERVADVLRRASGAAGVVPRDMTSMAAHDAQILSAAASTGLLFVPSIGGRSHGPDEATAAEDVVLATRVLATALYDLAFA